MNGPEHQRRAEEILAGFEATPNPMALAHAQIHATLAQNAILAERTALEYPSWCDAAEWRLATRTTAKEATR